MSALSSNTLAKFPSPHCSKSVVREYLPCARDDAAVPAVPQSESPVLWIVPSAEQSLSHANWELLYSVFVNVKRKNLGAAVCDGTMAYVPAETSVSPMYVFTPFARAKVRFSRIFAITV